MSPKGSDRDRAARDDRPDRDDRAVRDGRAVRDEAVPTGVRRAGLVVAAEGVVGIVVAVVLVVHGVRGTGDEGFISSYGTAGWFAVLGAGVLAGGLALVTGRRWGRAIAVVAQILLIPVGFALLTDSDRPYFGAPLLVVVAAVLAMLFAPSSVRWLSAADRAPDAPDEPTDEDAR